MNLPFDFTGFPERPNLSGYTAVPNVLFELLPYINNMSELKVLLAVFRKTYGWVKEIDPETGQPIYKLEDAISYTQFEKMTGLSSSSVSMGLSRAIQDGFIEKTEQGTFKGSSSTYRVVTEKRPSPGQGNGQKSHGVGLTTTVTPPAEPEKPGIVPIDLGPDTTPTPKTVGIPLAELTSGLVDGKPKVRTEKDDILDDIFGTPAVEPEKKEKKPTPHQQVVSKWYSAYLSKVGVAYGGLTGKDHGQIKTMLKEYPLETVLKTIDFYIGNYDTLENTPSDYPTLAIFFGWRKSLVPAALKGVNKPAKKRNAREYEEDKWENEDDFFNN